MMIVTIMMTLMMIMMMTMTLTSLPYVVNSPPRKRSTKQIWMLPRLKILSRLFYHIEKLDFDMNPIVINRKEESSSKKDDKTSWNLISTERNKIWQAWISVDMQFLPQIIQCKSTTHLFCYFRLLLQASVGSEELVLFLPGRSR